MKKIFTLIICLPIFCYAQKKTGGYAQLGGNLEVNKPLGSGGGGSFMVGHFVGNSMSIGAGFNIIKFKNLDKATPSIFADFRAYFGKDYKKPIPYLTLTPGYTFFNENIDDRGLSRTIAKGGFLFGAGVGCIFYSGHRIAPFFGISYNNFPIVNLDKDGNQIAKNNYNIANIIFGVKF